MNILIISATPSKLEDILSQSVFQLDENDLQIDYELHQATSKDRASTLLVQGFGYSLILIDYSYIAKKRDLFDLVRQYSDKPIIFVGTSHELISLLPFKPSKGTWFRHKNCYFIDTLLLAYFFYKFF